MTWADVTVACRSEVRYAQQPRAIQWPGGEPVAVTTVLGAWHTPAGPCFRVLTGSDTVELRYLEAEDRWQAR